MGRKIIELLDELQHEIPDSVAPQELKPTSQFGAGLSTQYATWLLEAKDDSSWLRTSAVASQLRAKPSKRVLVEVPALVLPFAPDMCRPERFSLLRRKRWRHGGKGMHINIKEAKVALSSVKRTCRVAKLHGTTKLSLTDNLSCLCCFERGRSSSFKMNVICRTAAAYVGACGLRWRLRRIETKRNPADFDSRFTEHGQAPYHKEPFSERRTGNPPETVQVDQPVVVNNSSFHLHHHPDPAPCSSPSTSPSKARRQSPGTGGHKGGFLEVFAGTRNLTAAVSKLGKATFSPLIWDVVAHNRLFGLDLSGWAGCTLEHRVQCFRFLKRLDGAREKERVGLELALFTAEAIDTCRRYRVKWSLS